MNLYRAKTIILTAILFIGATTAHAQKLQATLSHYSTDNGLASNAIADITQDDYGYIWLATWNGLSRFDGFNFYNYKTGAGSHVPNLHNRIYSLAIDNQQNVWMRMYDQRVFVLKRSTDQIINPFEGIPGSEEYRTKSPITITTSGYTLVNIDGIGLYKMRLEQNGVNSELITTGGLEVTSMAEGYQNDIWLGTDKGVHRMDLSNLTIERKGIFLEEYITTLFSNGYNIFVGTKTGKIMSFSYGQEPKIIRSGGNQIDALYVDSHGLIWFADKRQGVTMLDPATGREKDYVQNVKVPDYDGAGGKFNETNGIVWIRMNHGGYGYYNRETDEIEYFHNDPVNPWNLSNTVNAALELNEGVVWESTSRRGLEKLEILKNTIERKPLVPNTDNPMENEIRAFYYDNHRQLLLAGNKAGTLYFIHNDGSRSSLRADAKGYPFGRIYGISRDSKGNYWVSSKDNGVFMLSPASNGYSTQHFCHIDGNESTMNSNAAYNTIEDSKGNIWVATYGGGVNLIVKNQSGQYVTLHKGNQMKTYPFNSYQKVRTLALDKDSNVWAGTSDGILIMSYEDRKLSIKRLEASTEDPDHILLSNDVVCLAQDKQGNMWVGTNGGGLACTIGKDSDGRWLFDNYGAEDGLPSEEIRSITFDDRDNVWFATDHVICSFNTSKKIFTTFSSLDGVDETMCSEGGAISLPNGNILFGTLNGYYFVDRSKLSTSAGNIIKLRITDFWLNEELQSPRLNDTYNYYVPDSRSVELPGHNEVISFRFASLNFQLQHRIHYQYMLEGYDHGWQNADKTRMATYANLPTGSYRFRVKAFLLEAPEKYDQRIITVIVPPFFLLSSHAIWVYMLLGAILGVWLMFRIQRRLEKKEKVRLLREGARKQMDLGQESDSDFMRIVNEFMEVHFADPMLTIDELAAVSGTNSKDLARKFKQTTGQTPKEYIIDYRLKRAIEKLENTSDSIAQIAFDCGFSSAVGFNHIFSKKTGMTPSKYRDEHKSANAAPSEPEQGLSEKATDEYEIIEE